MATVGAAMMMLTHDAENPPSKTALILSRCWTVCGQSSCTHPLSRAIRTPRGWFRVLKIGWWWDGASLQHKMCLGGEANETNGPGPTRNFSRDNREVEAVAGM
jgi:hypothetical protein